VTALKQYTQQHGTIWTQTRWLHDNNK